MAINFAKPGIGCGRGEVDFGWSLLETREAKLGGQTGVPFCLDGRTMARRLADTFSSPRGRTYDGVASSGRKFATFSSPRVGRMTGLPVRLHGTQIRRRLHNRLFDWIAVNFVLDFRTKTFTASNQFHAELVFQLHGHVDWIVYDLVFNLRTKK